MLDTTIQNFLTVTNNKFYMMTLTHHNHHLAIKILTKAFMVYTKVLRKYIGVYDAYSRAFRDFLSALDILLNARLINHIVSPVKLETYHKTIDNLQKMSSTIDLSSDIHTATMQNKWFLLLTPHINYWSKYQFC